MPALGSLTVPDFQIGHEKQVDDVEDVVGLVHDDGPSTGGEGHELAVLDTYLSAVRQMNDEGPERGSIVRLPDLLDRHVSPNSINDRLFAVPSLSFPTLR